MSYPASHDNRHRNKGTRTLFLVLFSASCALFVQPLPASPPETTPVVFEVELPDFQMAPSSQTELVVPSANVTEVLIHVLKPVADNIDYSAIRTSINGQAASTISDIVSGLRGKVVRINLKSRLGYEFVTGRNTVEVWAQNRRGRAYYASFVIKTATENWNEEFIYEVQQSPQLKNIVPPQIMLLEPEHAIEFPPAMKSITVKISGSATASSEIRRVSVDGKSVPLTSGQETVARQLTRIASAERSVAFRAVTIVSPSKTQIVVEAEDSSGAVARVLVPIVRRPAVTTSFVGRKYALVVGISQYRNSSRGIRNLAFADADARSIYEVLQRREVGGFLRDDMLMLNNEQATIAQLRQALTSFIVKPSANDLLLIFVAGHGAPDPAAPQNLYVIAHDTSVTDMADTALPMSDLRKYVEQNIRCKRVIVLLDACHSAGFATDGTRDLSNNLTNLYLEKLLYREEGRAIITSSDVNEPSHESERWGKGHGVFTYYVLQGLKGSADTNRDRLVTVGELFRYVRQQVRTDTQFQQNPRMLIGDNENLVLAAVAPSR